MMEILLKLSTGGSDQRNMSVFLGVLSKENSNITFRYFNDFMEIIYTASFIAVGCSVPMNRPILTLKPKFEYMLYRHHCI